MGVMLGFKMNQQKPHSSSSSGIINFFLLLSFLFFFFSNKKEKKKGLLVTQLSLWHLTAVVIRPFSLIFGINYCFSICLSQNPIIMHKTKPTDLTFIFPSTCILETQKEGKFISSQMKRVTLDFFSWFFKFSYKSFFFNAFVFNVSITFPKFRSYLTFSQIFFVYEYQFISNLLQI